MLLFAHVCTCGQERMTREKGRGRGESSEEAEVTD